MSAVVRRPASLARKARQRGNVLVEFAVTSTVLLIIACGVTGFARIFNVGSMAAGAAAAGVQYGALSPAHYGDLTGMQNAALADTGNYPGATATATQFCTCSVGGTQQACPITCSSGTPETYIQVSVTVPYQSVINYPMLPNPVTITQVACARVQ